MVGLGVGRCPGIREYRRFVGKFMYEDPSCLVTALCFQGIVGLRVWDFLLQDGPCRGLLQ